MLFWDKKWVRPKGTPHAPHAQKRRHARQVVFLQDRTHLNLLIVEVQRHDPDWITIPTWRGTTTVIKAIEAKLTKAHLSLPPTYGQTVLTNLLLGINRFPEVERRAAWLKASEIIQKILARHPPYQGR